MSTPKRIPQGRIPQRRILVTGGAGFLGSHLCDRLIEGGHEVICLDNLFTGFRANIRHLEAHPRFEFLRADVADRLKMEVDQIYHLACPASPVHYQRNPVRTIDTCVFGTRNMLELARGAGARLLVASTSEVYGDPDAAHHPQVETYWGNVNPIGPRSCYDEGKRCAEALAVAFAGRFGVELRIARIFNTYGPRMHFADGRVVSNFVIQALQGRPLTIYGHGEQTRSFCYVDDLIEGFLRLMASDLQARPVNLGNPGEFTIRELAHKVLAITGAESPLTEVALPENDPQRRRPDITVAREELDWTPRVALDEGLRATVEDFRRRLREGPTD